MEYRSYQITHIPDNAHQSESSVSPENALSHVLATASDTNADHWKVQTVEVDSHFNVIFVDVPMSV